MLNDDYKRVATIAEAAQENTSQAAPQAIVHAQWLNPVQYQTMCGIDTLNLATMSKSRIVNCAACNAALKKERQRRSREGTANYQARMSAQREGIEATMTGYEPAGADMVYVPTEEIDRILISTLGMRAAALRQEGFESLAADLEITAGRLAEHGQIPDDTSVPKSQDATLSANSECPICADTGRAFGNRCTCPAGQALERRMRPRAIIPTIDNTIIGDEL
jgi:hypothetical protein